MASFSQALKAAEKALRAQEASWAHLRKASQTVAKGNEYVPPKRHTKGRGPITKGSRASYGANTFKECPGGTRAEATNGALAAIIKQIAAPDTGCRVASKETLERLTHSAKNCNTTTGNYNTVIVH